MRERIEPDYTDKAEEVFFTLYDDINVHMALMDWQFLCEKRWFSDKPFRDEVEAEFGLYGARAENTSGGVMRCIDNCVADLRNIIEPELTEEHNRVLDSNCETLLTLDENGNITVDQAKEVSLHQDIERIVLYAKRLLQSHARINKICYNNLTDEVEIHVELSTDMDGRELVRFIIRTEQLLTECFSYNMIHILTDEDGFEEEDA